MCDYKLSSEEVPTKFSEWLLAMGCPPEKVPSADKVVEMCRGQYYMVWRSLMEHVEPKEVVRQKRLHVFCDDIDKWKKKTAFNKPDNGTVMPEELVLWHEHTGVKEKVVSAEERVTQARQKLDQLMEKISSKLSDRNLSRQAVQNAQRRAWLLQQVADELRTKKENLEETRSIADSLCSTNDDVDVQSKLDRYMQSIRRGSAAQGSTSILAANPVASSSVVSNADVADSEEQVSWLSGCSEHVWPALLERRRQLLTDLAKEAPTKDTTGVSPQSVVAHTAAMHCCLALEAVKSRAHIALQQQRLAAAVCDLNAYLSGEACELLVVQCERARASARLARLQALLQQVTSREGVFFSAGAGDPAATTRQITCIDRAIESKKEDLIRLVSSLATTETKIHNARECLISIFNGFTARSHKDLSSNCNDRFRGQAEVSAESCASLRQFYEERRERRRRKVDLSMDLDVTENDSFSDQPVNPKFADEVRIYLKKFNLEKNRKLVLESGDKIWIFESLSEATSRLHATGACALLPPELSLSRGLAQLTGLIRESNLLQTLLEVVKRPVDNGSMVIDISREIKEEEATIDKIKKRLNDNLLSLQKTNKTLELGQENIKFWSNNEMRKYISSERKVDGKSYKDYEDIYMMNLS